MRTTKEETVAIQKAKISVTDFHGQGSNTSFYVSGAADARTAAQHIHNLSNARIDGVFVSSPFDITQLQNNGAVEANIESAKFRLVARYSAPSANGVAQRVLLKIPAPVGTVINGTFSMADTAPLQALVGKICAEDGTPTTLFHGVYYEG